MKTVDLISNWPERIIYFNKLNPLSEIFNLKIFLSDMPFKQRIRKQMDRINQIWLLDFIVISFETLSDIKFNKMTGELYRLINLH